MKDENAVLAETALGGLPGRKSLAPSGWSGGDCPYRIALTVKLKNDRGAGLFSRDRFRTLVALHI